MVEEMSLRTRRKKSSVGIICCFTGGTTPGRHRRRASFDEAAATSFNSSTAPICQPSPRWSPGWFKTRSNIIHTDHQLVDTKGKCRSFISRMGRHRRHASAEFSYDPLSYSLNFDEDVDDDARVTSFSARFPGSPSSSSARMRTPHAFYDDHEGGGGGGGGHLMRGFESLAESIKTRNKSGLSSSSSPRASSSSSSDDVVKPPVRISPNREILLQMC